MKIVIMTNKIIQGSPKWHEARKSKIGASEIFTLVHHYCAKELRAMGFDLLKEKSFRTIQELFLKIKFGAELSPIDPICAKFGNGMESYVAYRLTQKLPEIKIEKSKDFIINEILHPLAACSPDGYVETMNDSHIPDFDKTCEINNQWGRGALELKTANYFTNFGAEEGSKLQYIFQNQFQQMVLGFKWGIIAVLIPKQKEYDDPFFKGQILGRLYANEKLGSAGVNCWTPVGLQENIDQYYDLYYYIHPNLPVFQQMILKALNAFQADLDAYPADQSVFPRNSEDLTGLQREKKIWGQLWSDRFGILQLKQEDEVNYLLNQRHEAKIASMFAEGELLRIENEIKQKTEKYCEIIGTEQKMKWASNGVARFTKLK